MVTLIFILICYGACNNIIYGSIFEGFRNQLAKLGTSGYSLHKLFTCFMCLGTWMGFAISSLLIYFGYPDLTPMGSLGFMPSETQTLSTMAVMIFLNGLVSAAGVWLTHSIQEAFERAFVK